ncbi:MAG: DUF5329 domain-containing protein [Gammaproteobacteria bacterium]|nr:DUF5329 domain-containing protein [Gammaproteobacteria bacterium]
MNNGWLKLLGVLILGLALAPMAHAAPSAAVETEIKYLIGFIETSGCEFYRNGNWYDSLRAADHLRYKYKMLAASDRISTTEDFIEKAATKSSLSGEPYEVRCSGREPITSTQWLYESLAHYRVPHVAADYAPRVMRGALNRKISRRL